MLNSLKKQILEVDHYDLFSELIFDRTPHIFGGDASTCRSWTAKLAHLLNVDATEVRMVGSAAVGFSLSPYKDFSEFSDASDVDIAVVSDYYFSEAWHFLRTIDLTLAQVTWPQRAAIKEHQTRFIYWGCIAADKILPLLPFAQRWMAARALVSGSTPTDGRDVNFRIYKDFRALRTYQMRGLAKLKGKLLEGGR